MFIVQFSIIISLVFVLLMFIILFLQCTIRCIYTNKINNIENDEESVTNNAVLNEIFPNVRTVPYTPSVRNQTVSFQC